jgi:adenylate cyclase
MEVAVQEVQNDELGSVIQASPDAILVADEHGLIRGWNPAAERIFGYRAPEVLRQPLTLIIPERFREAHDAGIRRVVESGETRLVGQTVELFGLRRDGSEFPIELSLSTWTRNGRPYFGGIIRDISDRVRMRDELASSREQLNAVVRSASEAIVCADGAGRVTLWNPAAERMLGFEAGRILGAPLTTIIPARYRQLHEAGFERMLAGGQPRLIGGTAQVSALREDGTELPVELSLSMWTTAEGPFFGAIIRDVTERVRAEMELRSAHEALAEKTQQLEALSGKLAKYLSRQLYQSIFEGRTEVRVTSYRKKLTVFFSDIQGFTELTDSMEAEPLSELLNEYLAEMSTIASEHGGTVDKFIGDGIMIFFGDPESRGEKEDAVACVEMALAMQGRVREFQREWRERGISRSLHVRMGINTGYVTVGNFGSEDRLDYTIVGGQVNVAARLQTGAEPDQILVSGETHALVRDRIRCAPVGEIKVKGIAYPIPTYGVLGTYEDGPLREQAIDDERQGFRLVLDPARLSAADADHARTVLRHALETLASEEGPP